MPIDDIQSTPGSPENSSPEYLAIEQGEEHAATPVQQPGENPTDKPSEQLNTEKAKQDKVKNQIERSTDKKRPRWQERLLPLMAGMLIALAFFFFVATFLQISYMHWSILRAPAIDINPSADLELATSANTLEDRLEVRRLEVLSRMEAYVVEQRYHHASVLMMSGLWVRYLGFVTGMILALVGASFVLGKLREPVTELTSKFATSVDLSLRSASPGIILIVLGVVLMFATIIDRDVYEVEDMPVYLNPISVRYLPTEVPLPTMKSFEEFLTPNPSLWVTPTAESP